MISIRLKAFFGLPALRFGTEGRISSLRRQASGLLLALMAASASAAPVYLRSSLGAPWGQNTNETAMNTVFGSGAWQDLRYETVNTATLFTTSNNFIFMEGGDSTADELEGFLTSNTTAINNWVTAGGRLFINAAPNEGNGMDYGFGVTLNYPDFGGAESAVAVNPLHPIINGPFGPTGTSWQGGYFSHASLTGLGILSLINDGTGDSVLAELRPGAGLTLFGGMTTTNFHIPQPEATHLRENILAYAANTPLNQVSEPGTLALLGIALVGLSTRRRRDKQPDLA